MFLNEFSVCVYGELEKYNDVTSKSRVRIFYKYGNRNGTYITDEFAEKLIATLPYTVVSGIYSEEEKDFTDHGSSRSESRVYGIVPENPNASWEKHLDRDGVEREYLCADVLLFTARYPEARQIVGKSQSMELYAQTLKWHKEIKNGQVYAVFDEGCFLGLQALGDSHTPCFQGAAFYELQDDIESVITQIRNYEYKGEQEMPKLNFKLSDSQKHEAIWALLNEFFDDEHDWEISYMVCEVYDEYAIAFNYEENQYERVYYTKDDETDSVKLGDRIKVFMVDVTESEKNTLDNLRELNGNTYEAVNEVLAGAQNTLEQYEEAKNKISEYELKFTELNEENSTLNTKVQEINSNYEAKCSELEAKIQECEELQTYKLGIESTQKEAVIAEYESQLSDEIIESYRAKIDEYTVTDLDKELAYELKKSNPSVFTAKNTTPLVPKDNQNQGIGAILSRYKK